MQRIKTNKCLLLFTALLFLTGCQNRVQEQPETVNEPSPEASSEPAGRMKVIAPQQ